MHNRLKIAEMLQKLINCWIKLAEESYRIPCLRKLCLLNLFKVSNIFDFIFKRKQALWIKPFCNNNK
jgi:hypothetical protein